MSRRAAVPIGGDVNIQQMIDNPNFIPILIDLAVQPKLLKDVKYITNVVNVMTGTGTYERRVNNNVTIQLDKIDIVDLTKRIKNAITSGKCRTKAGFFAANWYYPIAAKNILSINMDNPATYHERVFELVMHNINLLIDNCS
jgi:hypothetical protein